MRSLTALIVASGILAIGNVALARDVHLPKTSADQLKQICDKVGGSFSQGTARYGCGTDCKGGKGTDCLVSCEPDKPCDAQGIGGKRPRSVEQALAPGKKK